MDLQQLRYFRTAAQMENISRAARYHRIPQPSMSKIISALERELGMPLFEREGNRLHLNQQGRLFLREVDKALLTIDGALSDLSDISHGLCGEVRLLVLENRRLISECTAAFLRRYPHVTVSLCHDLYSNQPFPYDLYISSAPGGIACQSRVLLTEDILLAVPREHRLALRQNVSLQDLSGESFVLLPQNNSAHRIAVEHCRRSGFEPITVIRCDDPCQVRYYVSQGLGVTFSPAISWKNLWDTNRVALLPINAAGLSRTSLICWRSGEHLSPAASVFRDFAAAYFAALPAEAPPVSSGRDLPSFERRAQ